MTSTYQSPYPALERVLLSQLVAKVREIVERDPNFIYYAPEGDDGDPGCVYVTEDNEPSCLLGRAMYECGVPLDELWKMDRPDVEEDSLPIRKVIYSAFGWTHGTVVDNPTVQQQVDWLSVVQREQDSSETYGTCVAAADEEAPLS